MHRAAVFSGKRLAESDCVVQELLAAVGRMTGDRRAARELLSLVWDVAPGWVSTHSDTDVPADVRERALTAARRVARGEPVAYATGRAAFRHLTLSVDHRALIPRPETEIVVDEALSVCSSGAAADVGTGSGAIALSLASEGRFDKVIATDVSADALALAQANATHVQTRTAVEFRCGSLLQPLAGEAVNLLVANPPYIAAAEMRELPSSVRDWEPPLALLSGADGLDHTRQIVAGAPALLKPGGWVVLECDSRRADAVAALLFDNGSYSDIRVVSDLAGLPRVAVARRRTR